MLKKDTMLTNKNFYWPLVIAVSGLVVALFSYWFIAVHSSPRQVFSDMLDNSLSLHAFTREVKQGEEGNMITKLLQVQLGAEEVAKSKTTILTTTEDMSTKIETEAVGTKEGTFVRYNIIDIKSEEMAQRQFDEVINVWGEEDEEGSLLTEGLFGPILFGRLVPSQRNELISYMKENEVYRANLDDVASKNVDGRRVFEYKVQVQPSAYIGMLQKYNEILGGGYIEQLEPAQFESSPPIEFTLQIDRRSRLVYQIIRGSEQNQQIEKIIGYGVKSPITQPDASEIISRSELEERVQSILMADD